MSSTSWERRVYQPVAMGVKPLRQPTKSGSAVLSRRKTSQKTFSRQTTSLRTSPVRPGSSSVVSHLLPLPLVLAAFLFFVALAWGLLDPWILQDRTVATAAFPHEVSMDIPVLKASLSEPSNPESATPLVFTRHRVGESENLSRIAYDYGLSPGTLISVNQLSDPGTVRSGKVLIIPYRDGIRVSPRKGETGADLARRFGTPLEMVQIFPDGSDFFVSGGNIQTVTPAAFVKDVFLYPVAGRILSGFGVGVDEITGIPYESDGIDLSVPISTPVGASREGTVILTGHHSSYGLYVMMSHTGGWKSFYGNMERIDVAPGDKLKGGEIMGLTGRSGAARSPRLHFALLRDGESVDPLDYLF